MKYKVKIHDKLYQVDIESLDQRPILAKVNGYIYEVYPVEEQTPESTKAKVSREIPQKTNHQPSKINAVSPLNAVKSPIPGVVNSIDVSVGQEVREGDPLCVIEAMKMKNTIRSPRDGVIKFVPIHVGKHVRHNEVLIEFEGD
ncbi:MAG: hypothetical protein Kow0088_25440 [Anaerolineales bacterium]